MKNVILRYVFYVMIFLIFMILFLPKMNLYYLGLDKLKTNKIILVSHDIEDKLLSFNMNNVMVNYENKNTVKLNRISLCTYIYISKLEITDITFNDRIKDYIPKNIKKLIITYNLMTNPLKIDIESTFTKGKFFGHVDLLERKVVINLDVSHSFIKDYKDLTKKFTKKGEYYSYEYKY